VSAPAPNIVDELRSAAPDHDGTGYLMVKAAARIAELTTLLERLAVSADTAELLLRTTHPGKAESLRGHVGRAKQALDAA